MDSKTVLEKRRKATALINAAERELRLYRKSGSFTSLSQACEKTWVAYTLALEAFCGVELKHGESVRNASMRVGWDEAYQISHKLHILHYEGSPSLEFIDRGLIRDIASVHYTLRILLNKLSVKTNVKSHWRKIKR